MDDTIKGEYESKCQQLRVDLKTWETTWAKGNGGKKPGRDDIKRNPDIAHKYKQYQKCRDILDGKVPPPTKEESRSRKRKSDGSNIVAPSETPLKRTRHAETPSKDRTVNDDQQLEATPSISRKLFSPAAVTSLGPTPQRDGRVLGLFDLLEEGEVHSPSSRKAGKQSPEGRQMGLQATPKKAGASDVESTPRMGRTPMSASKRQYLNNFMSPLKSRSVNAGAPRTPSALHFDTPQFLKRHNLATVDENGEATAPVPLKLPRKPLGRGLSEIVASLRKVEEDKADEDLDALREMEAEELGIPVSKKNTASTAAMMAAEREQEILVKDSQMQHLPLGGFDDEAMYDSPVEEQRGTNGNPLKVYKKKGQKRTTRKVNIKPTWNKRPSLVEAEHGGSYEDEDEDEHVIPKTQQDNGSGAGDQDYQQDGTDSEGEDIKRRTKSQKEKQKKRSRKPTEPGQKEGPVKKAARKVNELAHANFQRLKLRQNGAKGGPGYNSRFRRRR